MDIHQRLKAARVAAGYSSVADAARAFGWNVNTTASNENGNRTYSRVGAEKYARAYHVSLEWLLTGRGSMKSAAPESAEIIDIWSRIPKSSREAARIMLESLAKSEGEKS